MIAEVFIALALVLISFLVDRKKTLQAIRKGMLQFLRILPTLLSVIMIISIVLHFVSEEVILKYLGEGAGWEAYLSAAILGSVSLIPGFIAFPLAGILVKSGVAYAVIAVFITTLLMVGLLTLPIEAKYFGLKSSLLRNALSFLGAIVVGTIMVIIYTFS